MRGIWGFILILGVATHLVASEPLANECNADLREIFANSELYSPEPVLLSVIVIIERDGKVLMNKRKSGFWGFAGGQYEACDRSIADCARRETFEEVGVTLKNLKFKKLQKVYVEERKKTVVVAILTGEIESGIPQVKEPEKSSEWQWFSWSNLPQPLFAPNQKLLDEGFDPFQ